MAYKQVSLKIEVGFTTDEGKQKRDFALHDISSAVAYYKYCQSLNFQDIFIRFVEEGNDE